jgi:hypothetical protein
MHGNVNTSSKVVGRIWPKVAADPDRAVNAAMLEKLGTHPLVLAALARADNIMSSARAKATNTIAEGLAAAVRAVHNDRLRAARQM